MDQYIHELKIPKERIAVLIGTKGETKKEIEELTASHIDVDSKEGEVFLSGKDALKLITAQEIVKAIARGFNPQVAYRLLKQDYTLEIVQLNEFVKHKGHFQRIRGRLIGKNGKARHNIEEMTDCSLCVYGKTASIIGDMMHVPIAKRAVESLLEGAQHATVYRWLAKKRREIRINSRHDELQE